jgi:hypothetical protein
VEQAKHGAPADRQHESRRPWRLALGVFAFTWLPFGTPRLDWTRSAVMNPTTVGVIGYSLPYEPTMLHEPTMLRPRVAWLGRDGRSVRAVLACLRTSVSRAAACRPRLYHGRPICA